MNKQAERQLDEILFQQQRVISQYVARALQELLSSEYKDLTITAKSMQCLFIQQWISHVRNN